LFHGTVLIEIYIYLNRQNVVSAERRPGHGVQPVLVVKTLGEGGLKPFIEHCPVDGPEQGGADAARLSARGVVRALDGPDENLTIFT